MRAFSLYVFVWVARCGECLDDAIAAGECQGGDCLTFLQIARQQTQQLTCDQWGFVFVDGGSSGSKYFSFDPYGGDMNNKYLTEDTNGIFKGVAALKADPYIEKETGNSIARDKFYRRMLGLIWDIHTSNFYDWAAASNSMRKKSVPTSGGDRTYVLKKPYNWNDVPFLSTAGMRVMSEADNNVIWESLCKKTPSIQGSHMWEQMTFSDQTIQGGLCGTIPGTTEGLYEWYANTEVLGSAKNGHVPMGMGNTVGVGGASMQIAIPVYDPTDFTAVDVYASGNEEWFRNQKLDGGIDNIPFFNVNYETSPWRDFAFLHTQIPDTFREHFPQKFYGVYVVSALSLGHAQQTPTTPMVAGGTNQVELWAKQKSCGMQQGQGTATWEGCKTALEDALKADVVWELLRKAVQANKKQLEPTRAIYHLNTPVIRPRNIFEVDADNWHDRSLRQNAVDNLETKCGHSLTGWGFQKGVTCMKAYFIQLVLDTLVVECKGETHGGDVPWANGVNMAQLTASEYQAQVEYSESNYIRGLHAVLKANTTAGCGV